MKYYLKKEAVFSCLKINIRISKLGARNAVLIIFNRENHSSVQTEIRLRGKKKKA